MYSLLYVSRALIEGGDQDEDVERIVRVSVERNRSTAVTGALIFTGARFAQWLEGEEQAVKAIMASIARDPRHCEVVIIEEGRQERRCFAGWSLAYGGGSTFAAATVERALAGFRTGDSYAVRNLIRLLQELARPVSGE
ncbi:BLUF domain-containing protein [Sphingomonas sp. ID1715]|uniref:BLUF domain-containing protein n=1 Tax=Sphingomonas sp. ID1715 TaxID=1656898 RepID=UPI001487F6F4|nr:BLUF domain-containing protein [Sphingomonas sp. ID1715]NNM76701.1 BLUF domain-containing protein [Sphingomonas sp. ID1715]